MDRRLAGAILVLFAAQAATVYLVVRRLDMLPKRHFAGWGQVGRTGISSLPVIAIPVVILGGILSGVFTPTESAAVAAVVAIGLALFWFGSISPTQLPGALTLAALEAGIVMLLLGDSQILAKALFLDGFGQSLRDFMTGITTDKHVFLLVVNLLLLAVGIFIEPLPANSPFRGLRNVSLTPHIAGPTTDRRCDAGAFTLENLTAYASGRPLRAVVTPAVYDTST